MKSPKSESREEIHERGRSSGKFALKADRMSLDQWNCVRMGEWESEGHMSRIRLEPNIL